MPRFGETQLGHTFVGSGKFENKHGVGILVNMKWRNHIIWTDCISERAMSTSIIVNKQQTLMMSVYFRHSEYADHLVETMYRSIEKHTKIKAKNMKIVGGDFNAEMGPRDSAETVDFKKAFDSKCHQSLWASLEQCGIESHCIWLLMKGQSERTKKVTCLRKREVRNRVILCQAYYSTRCSKWQ